MIFYSSENYKRKKKVYPDAQYNLLSPNFLDMNNEEKYKLLGSLLIKNGNIFVERGAEGIYYYIRNYKRKKEAYPDTRYHLLSPIFFDMNNEGKYKLLDSLSNKDDVSPK